MKDDPINLPLRNEHHKTGYSVPLHPVKSPIKQSFVASIATLPFPTLVCLLLFALTYPSRAQQRTTNATVHLKNGLIQSVKIHSANNNGIQWSSRSSLNPKLLPHTEIARIDFPEPDLWKQANTFFYAGNYPKAIAAFSSLANNPRGNFHPAPGNYTSRARLRLIECYRETGNAKGIGEVAATLNAESLPKPLRTQMDVISCWAELSKGNWGAAITKADALAANPILPAREDLSFIKAVALEKTGRTKEAIIAYGAAYTFDFGGSRELAKRGVKNAILLLLATNDEGREGELHALVHIYAKVYNQGKIWEGAPAKVIELLSKEMELPGVVDSSTDADPSEAKSMSETNASPNPTGERSGQNNEDSMTFAGVDLKPGSSNSFELTAESGSKFKVVMMLPEGFSATKQHSVFFVNTADNKDATTVLKSYGVLLRHNTIVLAANRNEAKSWQDVAALFQLMWDKWSGSKDWPVIMGGNWGGAEKSAYAAAYMMKNGANVAGMFMAGCSNDRTGDALKSSGLEGSENTKYKKVPVFLSSGLQAKVPKPAVVKQVQDSMNEYGMEHVRLETFDGGGAVYKQHLTEALKWFLSLHKD